MLTRSPGCCLADTRRRPDRGARPTGSWECSIVNLDPCSRLTCRLNYGYGRRQPRAAEGVKCLAAIEGPRLEHSQFNRHRSFAKSATMLPIMASSMKTVLFCGGLGTRIRDYSNNNIPKPM